MTADVELLPLPDELACDLIDYADRECKTRPSRLAIEHAIQRYARANVAHATAAMDAEIEALRAEVEALKDAAHMANGTAGLAMKHRDMAEARAERLAEALRRYGVHDQACVAANIPICTCGLAAALEQENDDA